MRFFAAAIIALCAFVALVAAQEEDKIGTTIGIDLGTTYSCVGVMKNGKVEIIANEQGNRITPSYVAFTENERLVGDAAKNQAAINPENTVFDAKRLIGRKFLDKEVQYDIQRLPYKVVNKDGKPHMSITVKGQTSLYAPEQISAMVLAKMRDIAVQYLGKPIVDAVVTVPAYFNDAQRQATKDAGTISGLKVRRIINEPTAAAIAFALDHINKEDGKNILVFDLGGGTFDVSLLTIEQGVFEVVATSGDTHLGGEDFDRRTIDFLLKTFKKKTNKDASNDKRAVQRLRHEVERAKRALSTTTSQRIELEAFFDGEDFSEMLTRAKFEELNMDLFKKTMEPVQKVIDDSRLGKDKIDEIVLVGGSTRIPKVRQLLKDFFNGKEPNAGVNPDEAVAYGAAVQGAILSGEGGDKTADVVLVDVTPLTLGIATVGDVMSKMIDRNTAIPTRVTQEFTTEADNQREILIEVYEGERAMVKDNHKLGEFTLDGIPPAPRGVPQVDVTFELDANGILQVSAVDRGTGNKEKITITNEKGRLSKDEIDKMIRDAEANADRDKLFRLRSEAFQTFEHVVSNARKAAYDKKVTDRLDGEDVNALKEAIKNADKWVAKNQHADVSDIEDQQKEFESTLSPIFTRLYQQGWREDSTARDSDDDSEVDYSHDEL